ncbi:MAG: diguanylate cyclase [Pseudomonadales bacterium]
MTVHKKILAVDDDVGQLILAEEVFAAEGYQVITASSGEDALEKVRSHHPDVILLDLMMPVMDGYATCEAIKQIAEHQHTPIIVLTGRDDIEAIEKSFGSGAWDFTSKPLNWPVLRHRVRYALAASEAFASERNAARLSRIIENSVSEVIVFDVESKNIISANQSARDNLGYSLGVIKQARFTDIASDKERKALESRLSELQENSQIKIKCRLRRLDGTSYPVEGVIIYSADEKPFVFTSIFQDVTERDHAERKLHQLAFFDELTGLANRRMLKEHVQKSIEVASATNACCALYMLDLDGFKNVNDELGHSAGDELLQEVACRLNKLLRDEDLVCRLSNNTLTLATTEVARLGGDEFIIFLMGFNDCEVPKKIADRLLLDLAKPYSINSNNLSVTASIGVALYPEHGTTLELLMMHADSAMYSAKRQGKNKYAIYSSNIDKPESLKFLSN